MSCQWKQSEQRKNNVCKSLKNATPLYIAPTDRALCAWCVVLMSPCWWKQCAQISQKGHCTLHLLIKHQGPDAQYWVHAGENNVHKSLKKATAHCAYWSSIKVLMLSTESMLVKTMCTNLSKRPLHIAPTDQASSAWCSVLSPCWWKQCAQISQKGHCTLRLLIKHQGPDAQYWVHAGENNVHKSLKKATAHCAYWSSIKCLMLSTESMLVKTNKAQGKQWAPPLKNATPLHITPTEHPGFFPGGLGVPPSGENFVNPPIRHLSPFLVQGLFPSPSRGWKI